MKTKILPLVVCLFAVLEVIGAEPIQGAFGWKLGEALDSSVTAKTQVSGFDPMYEVEPRLEAPGLTHYFVRITPHTRRIHSICGSGRAEDRDTALEFQSKLMKAISRKYGRRIRRMPGDSHMRRIQQDDRRIVSWIQDVEGSSVITFLYEDEAIKADVEKERGPARLAALKAHKAEMTAARERYVRTHDALSERVKDAILNSQIVREMTTKDVQIAWGTPDRRSSTVDQHGKRETWIYSDRYFLRFMNDSLESWSDFGN